MGRTIFARLVDGLKKDIIPIKEHTVTIKGK
jgi:hypothetical protein